MPWWYAFNVKKFILYNIFIKLYYICGENIIEMNLGYILEVDASLNELSDSQKNNKYWTLIYIKNGSGMYLLDGSLRCLNEGDVFVLPPRINYSFATDDLGDEYNINMKSIVLRFDNAWLDTVLTAFPAFSDTVLKLKELRCPLSIRGPKWIKMAALLDEAVVCDRSQQPIKILNVLSLLSTPQDCVLIQDVHECDTQNIAEKKAKIDRYLECNYCSRLSLEDISGYVGMSRTYFSQFFKIHYKEGFSDRLTRIRVEKASRMLLNTNKSLSDVASECGFKTVQYFTRAFKKVKGITPGTFRRKSQ